MTNRFSNVSARRLATCHPDLQAVMNEAIRKTDFSILCGFRGKEEQDKAFNSGKSKLRWPKSKHNSVPSKAVDIAPWPLDWKDIQAFIYLSKVIFETADELGIKLRWGGDFNMDGDKTKNDAWDLPHYELV